MGDGLFLVFQWRFLFRFWGFCDRGAVVIGADEGRMEEGRQYGIPDRNGMRNGISIAIGMDGVGHVHEALRCHVVGPLAWDGCPRQSTRDSWLGCDLRCVVSQVE